MLTVIYFLWPVAHDRPSTCIERKRPKRCSPLRIFWLFMPLSTGTYLSRLPLSRITRLPLARDEPCTAARDAARRWCHETIFYKSFNTPVAEKREKTRGFACDSGTG